MSAETQTGAKKTCQPKIPAEHQDQEVTESGMQRHPEAHLDTHHCNLLQGTALAETGLDDLLRSLPNPAVL